jgi:hypothetical protein
LQISEKLIFAGVSTLIVLTLSLTSFQDPFRYSYPPLPDDDFQTPTCENGPIVSEDDNESKEGESEGKELESSFSSEVAVKPKKVQRLPFYLSTLVFSVLFSKCRYSKEDNNTHRYIVYSCCGCI